MHKDTRACHGDTLGIVIDEESVAVESTGELHMLEALIVFGHFAAVDHTVVVSRVAVIDTVMRTAHLLVGVA
jgi:hypothetical protein